MCGFHSSKEENSPSPAHRIAERLGVLDKLAIVPVCGEREMSGSAWDVYAT